MTPVMQSRDRLPPHQHSQGKATKIEIKASAATETANSVANTCPSYKSHNSHDRLREAEAAARPEAGGAP